MTALSLTDLSRSPSDVLDVAGIGVVCALAFACATTIVDESVS